MQLLGCRLSTPEVCSTPGNLPMKSIICASQFAPQAQSHEAQRHSGKRRLGGKGCLEGKRPGNRTGHSSHTEWGWQHRRGDLTQKTHCKPSSVPGECITCRQLPNDRSKRDSQNHKGWERSHRSPHPTIKSAPAVNKIVSYITTGARD